MRVHARRRQPEQPDREHDPQLHRHGHDVHGRHDRPDAKAMILVDSRLYAQLGTEIDQYKAFAQARRGFAIDLRKEQQSTTGVTAVKEYIVNARASNPALEGVLFVGNIKLPSFYKSRIDTR